MNGSASPAGARGALLEVCAATLAAAGLIRLQSAGGGWWARLAPAVLVYLPLFLLMLRRLPLAEHGFGLPAWRAGLRWLVFSIAIALVPFAALALAWRWSAEGRPPWILRTFTPLDVVEQMAMIVIPEELFFRGYVQRRLDLWAQARGMPHSRVPTLLTAFLFALGHVLIAPGWLRAAVFLPGLVMSWLRERSGGLLAPAGFHLLSNLFWLAFFSGAGARQ